MANMNNMTTENFRKHHFEDLRAGVPPGYDHVARARAIHQQRNSPKNTVVFIENDQQLQELIEEIRIGRSSLH